MPEKSQERESNADEGWFFQRLRRDLDRQIADYVYEIPESAIGTPLTAEVITKYLDSMRECLVTPHWEEVNICNPEESLRGVGVKRRCVTMAEENGYALIFDPSCEEYHLAWRGVALTALAHGVFVATTGLSALSLDSEVPAKSCLRQRRDQLVTILLFSRKRNSLPGSHLVELD